MYQSAVAAVTNYYKLHRFKQPKFIILQFWGQKFKVDLDGFIYVKCRQDCTPLWRLQGRPILWPLPPYIRRSVLYGSFIQLKVGEEAGVLLKRPHSDLLCCSPPPSKGPWAPLNPSGHSWVISSPQNSWLASLIWPVILIPLCHVTTYSPVPGLGGGQCSASHNM